MDKRLAFAISAAMTTLAVAAVWLLAVPGDSLAFNNQAAETEVVSQEPSLNQVEEVERLNSVLLQREEVYRAELDKANQQLKSLGSTAGVGYLDIQSDGFSDDRSPDRINRDARLISRDEASRIALFHSGGGQIRKVELEREHGSSVYEVELKTSYGEREIYVDATTGEVLFSEAN